MNIFQQIFSIGLDKNIQGITREKVITSNQFAFYLTFFQMFYLILSIMKAPVLMQWPLMGILGNLVVLTLNHLRLFQVSRVILCLVPMSIVIIYNSYLTPEGANPRTSGFIVAMVHLLIPFLIFDVREKKFQWSLFIILAGFLLSMFKLQDVLNDPLIDYDTLYAPNSTRGAYLGLLGMGILMLLMQRERMSYRLESERLNRESIARNIELEKSDKELREVLEKVQITKIEDEQRTWTTQRLAEFNDLTRTVENLDDLIDHSTSFLAKVLDLNQVAVFSRVEDKERGDYLRRQSVYAYDRKKYLNSNKIEQGEGLIGQCFLEKKPIVLEDVPSGYLNISSGLGDITASFVAIYPLKAYDKVEGVIEIASFKVLEKYKLEFLSRVCESLAITILNKLASEKLKELLAISQQQAEQMRSQEEEMRQNLEEMQATQEEMKRNEDFYQTELSRIRKQGE
ncbi:GAF domain-containing protein [Flammeovirga sp. EKP202]|uniref:GAF domain-containing protein n=1 Tax=Flammeovirga sp. EKP202 TaxID=2770592 RepID=UPI00165F552D|nr:GAF domain-containing protein [Flammeovirga sp. EKP202]MBD0400498.1 GAF domain-containing protein [Flammeovirga sp. EKP202]